METDTRDNANSEPKRPLRRRRGFQVVVGLVGVVGLAIGWYLFSPLFFNKTVIEDFPIVPVAGASSGTTEAPNDAAASDPATSEPATSAGATSEADVPTVDVSFEPIVLADGEFVGADAFHQGSGSATIYELEDGSRILRLENFDVTNGPELHVFVSPNPAPESSEELMGSGYLDLGPLKGNRGDQNYEIPADAVLPDGEFSIVIYCEPFSVVFATATVSA